MPALCFHAVDEPLRLTTLPDPEPGPDDVIIKVARCGICGTDIHRTEENMWTLSAGAVPGHEFAGEVVALGCNVADLRMGAVESRHALVRPSPHVAVVTKAATIIGRRPEKGM